MMKVERFVLIMEMKLQIVSSKSCFFTFVAFLLADYLDGGYGYDTHNLIYRHHIKFFNLSC